MFWQSTRSPLAKSVSDILLLRKTSILSLSTQFYSILFYSILLNSILFFAILEAHLTNVDWYPLFSVVTFLNTNMIYAFSWNHNHSVSTPWFDYNALLVLEVLTFTATHSWIFNLIFLLKYLIIISLPCFTCIILMFFLTILSYPTLSYPTLSYPTYPTLPYLFLYYPILSYPILSYPILPIQSFGEHCEGKATTFRTNGKNAEGAGCLAVTGN